MASPKPQGGAAGAAGGWGPGTSPSQPEKRRILKTENKIARSAHGNVRPKAPPEDKRQVAKDFHGNDRSAMAQEEQKQLNLKKLQFLLKQETRNNETVRRLVDLVTSLCSFFRMLPKSLQVEVCQVMKLETYVRNELVFSKGDPADKFFIVANGKVEICVNDISDMRSGALRSVAVLQRGESFGEVALMMDALRTATAVVQSTRAELLCVTRVDFQRVLHDIYGVSLQERLYFLRSLATFKPVPTFKLEAMAHLLQGVVHKEGTAFDIVKDSQLYFVVEGECRLKRVVARTLDFHHKYGGDHEGDEAFYDFNTISRLGPGDFFGEASAFPEVRQEGWYVEAHTKCKMYTMPGGGLLSDCSKDIISIMRSAALFKHDYYQSRLATLQGMDEQRKGKPATMIISRPKSPTTGASSRSLRQGEAHPDSDDIEMGVLEELKQHILESALDLEKQRLDIYHRTIPKPGHADTQNLGGQSSSPKRGQRGVRASSTTPTSPAPRVRTSEARKNAYPRSVSIGEAPLPPVEALRAAGGLQVLAQDDLEATRRVPPDSTLDSRERAGRGRGAVEECSGYMQTGGPGYIGYDLKHVKAQIATQQKQQHKQQKGPGSPARGAQRKSSPLKR